MAGFSSRGISMTLLIAGLVLFVVTHLLRPVAPGVRNAGIAALVTALVLGKRRGYPTHISPPHNLPFAVLGA